VVDGESVQVKNTDECLPISTNSGNNAHHRITKLFISICERVYRRNLREREEVLGEFNDLGFRVKRREAPAGCIRGMQSSL